MEATPARGVTPRRVAVAAAVALVLLAALPPARARLKAAPTLAEALGVGMPRPLASAVEPAAATYGGLRGHRYGNANDPALLLVPGATERGLADPRVRRVATALARAGRHVFVPDLALYERRFDIADLSGLAAATAELHERSGGPVTLLGFSYGGGFALRVAADPALREAIGAVAVFGTYFDLVGVLQAVTTGVAVVGGQHHPWTPDPAAEDLVPRVLARFAPPGERAAVEAALRDAGSGVAGLSPAARAIVALGRNDDPGRVAALVARLDDATREQLAAFSPAPVADRITVPVLALHAVDDPAVPYAESLRLMRAVPSARLVTVRLFRHVDLDAGGWWRTLPDLVRVWRYVGDILAGQEPTVP